MSEIIRKRMPLLLLIVLGATFLPWLGCTLFYTKGEPREAIVAMSMLQSGNWILPTSAGADIPFKPPFLAWCIAAVSWLVGGVSEYTSRLPSALALICLCMATYRFFVRAGKDEFFSAALVIVMVTSVEVWRAGFACRVDMVLTACTVCAMYCLYDYIESGMRGVPLCAILLMTCGVLTKGPVGMLIPCGVIGVFGLVRGHGFLSLLWRLGLIGLLACIVPALWYYLAYQQGGDSFLSLAMEENFGRFLGKMSYDSHVKPVWYNFVTVALGMLPYTLLALMSLVAVKWSKFGFNFSRISDAWRKFRSLNPATIFAIVAIVVVFVFYCIPKSKRSVYLLPIYPFLAYYITLMISWLSSGALVRWYGRIMTVVCGVIVLSVGVLPFIAAFRDGASGLMPIGSVLGLIAGVGVYVSWRNISDCHKWSKYAMFAALVPTMWLISGFYLPAVVNVKSDKAVVSDLVGMVSDCDTVYGYSTVDMHRFFTLNYYMNDAMRVYDKENPSEGVLVVGDKDFECWNNRYAKRHEIISIVNTGRTSCDTRRQKILIIKFKGK